MSTSSVPEPAFRPNYAHTHGCAWFVFPDEGLRQPGNAQGWASLGGEPAFPFKSWKDLSKDAVWWTNLSKPESWTLGQWGRFKDGGFLGAEWLTLMNEWGQPLSGPSMSSSVQRASELLTRMGFWLSHWSTTQTPEQPWEWGQGDLPDALGQRWGWTESSPQDPQPVFQAAYLASVAQDIPSSFWQGRRRVALPFPRLAHVRHLWETRYPVGAFSPLERGHWPSSARTRAPWAEEQTAPLLLRVDQISWRAGEEEKGWLWLGLRGRPFAGAEREPLWLTGEEIRTLHQWADLEITTGYRGTGWSTEAVPSGWPLSHEDPLAVHGLMSGLLGWAAFRAASSPTRDPTRRNKSQVTARSLWWRAAERQKCFEGAWRLHQKGLPIAEYGNGQVVVILSPEASLPDLAQIIRDSGFVVPPVLARTIPRSPYAEMDDPVSVAHWLRHQGDAEILCDIDRIVAPWPGTLSQVKSVLSGSATRLLGLLDKESDEGWQASWKEILNNQARISIDRIKRQSKKTA